MEAISHALDGLHIASPGSILKLPAKMSALAFEPPMLATSARTLFMSTSGTSAQRRNRRNG
jgi:hypothetical protein